MINATLNKLNPPTFIYETWSDIDIGLISSDIDQNNYLQVSSALDNGYYRTKKIAKK